MRFKKTKVAFLSLIVLFLITFISWVGLTMAEIQTPLNDSDTLERPSPGDWLQEKQIKVYTDKVVLDLPGASWAKFTNSNSMDPLFDDTANAIEVHPAHPEDINVGDIISYRSASGLIVHRVIEKGLDTEGVYYLVKGDNNTAADSNKVRFEDIVGVVVAIVY